MSLNTVGSLHLRQVRISLSGVRIRMSDVTDSKRYVGAFLNLIVFKDT